MYSKMGTFQTTQELVRGPSNLLVDNTYWMVAFKIHVSDTLLSEETPNKSNSKIWKPFLQKQPSRGVLKKRCSENMQQIYKRTPMPKCEHL